MGSPIDVIMVLVLLVVSLGFGSLTLLGETIRSASIIITGGWTLVALSRAASDAGQRYEFGTGKLEQAGNAAVALALALAGLWLASRAFDRIVLATSAVEPFGLALAATANAVLAVRTGFLVAARSTAEAKSEQPPHAVPSPAGASRLLSLLLVQITLTVAALVRDPAIALAADGLGAICLGLLMMAAGVRSSGWRCWI
jgi:divalent metal cation (Fe/Co/Zn/Cd) transporter